MALASPSSPFATADAATRLPSNRASRASPAIRCREDGPQPLRSHGAGRALGAEGPRPRAMTRQQRFCAGASTAPRAGRCERGGPASPIGQSASPDRRVRDARRSARTGGDGGRTIARALAMVQDGPPASPRCAAGSAPACAPTNRRCRRRLCRARRPSRDRRHGLARHPADAGHPPASRRQAERAQCRSTKLSSTRFCAGLVEIDGELVAVDRGDAAVAEFLVEDALADASSSMRRR